MRRASLMCRSLLVREAKTRCTTSTETTSLGKWPSDLSVERISRTTTENMVIDEFIVRFTHDVVMDAVLPGLAPDGSARESCRTWPSSDLRRARSHLSASTGIRARCSSSSGCSMSTACRLVGSAAGHRRCWTRMRRLRGTPGPWRRRSVARGFNCEVHRLCLRCGLCHRSEPVILCCSTHIPSDRSPRGIHP